MKRPIFPLTVLLLCVCLPMSGAAAGLTISIHDGRVSIDATDVSLRQILAEWSRVGHTRIVNVERVSSAPMTLKLDGVPEDEALDIILRSVPGYVAAPRSTRIADASIYDRILLMPVTSAVASSTRPPQTQGFQPQPGMTQLRSGAPLNPGLLPEPPDDPPAGAADPALAAAAAAGLMPLPTSPAGQPTYFGASPLAAPTRAGETPQAAPATPAATPSNPWNAPVGTSRPGPAAPLTPSTTPQPNRPGGALRPPQADQ